VGRYCSKVNSLVSTRYNNAKSRSRAVCSIQGATHLRLWEANALTCFTRSMPKVLLHMAWSPGGCVVAWSFSIFVSI
jgi:hypothetical protein